MSDSEEDVKADWDDHFADMVPEDICGSCGAPLDAVGGCTGSCDPADPKFYPEDEW